MPRACLRCDSLSSTNRVGSTSSIVLFVSGGYHLTKLQGQKSTNDDSNESIKDLVDNDMPKLENVIANESVIDL